MDSAERLSGADLARGDYLAASHLHRYALAAELCTGLRVADVGCGTGYGAALLREAGATVTGVDVDAGAITAARREHPGPEFVCEDALAYLRRADPGSIDAVVMFEVLEHMEDLAPVLEELDRLAKVGVRLMLSVPNSRALGEDNPYHLTDFGITEARAAFARFDGAEWLFQHLAEGSVVLGADAEGGDPLPAQVAAVEQAEAEYANTFIVVVGFGAGAPGAASAALKVLTTPNHNRYMLAIERSNRELWDENRTLAQGIYGKHDAAAAVASAALSARIAELEDRAWILAEEKRIADARVAQMELWHDAARYKAVDRAVAALRRVPLVYPLLKLVRRVFRLMRPRERLRN